MTVGSKPKKKDKRDDDELFPETPAARKGGDRPAKPAKSEKREKVEKPEKVEKAPEPPKKPAREEEPRKARDEAPVAAPPPPPAREVSTPRPAAASSGSGARKLVLGFVALVAVGGVGVFAATQLGDSKPTTPNLHLVPRAPIVAPSVPPVLKPTTAIQPVAIPRPALSPANLKPIAAGHPLALPGAKPAVVAKKKGLSAEELAKKSANHAAIARTLEAFDAVRKTVFGTDDRLMEDYRAKQKREAELIDQIRALGPAGIDAMKDMITELDDNGYRMLVAKALAGMKDPDALKATADLLKTSGDLGIETTLARWLPDGTDTNGLLAQAFQSADNSNERTMLLREYARRVGEPDIGNPDAQRNGPMDDSAHDLFRQAATNDPDPTVRAEAVQIIGRRSDPRDMDLMAQIAQNDPNLQIRQSAIVAYALTGQDQALPTLGQLATSQDNQVEVRASAVLAIARVGGQPAGRDQALAILDQIAQNDGSDQIRQRAQSFANSIRANMNQPQQRPLPTRPVQVLPPRR